MNSRIIGIDVARALAIIGMVIVNFKVVLGEEGKDWIKLLSSVFDGKASATFVVLAGVGIAMGTNSAIRNNDVSKLRMAQIKITKRALLLFIIGLSYMVIWQADILHFYGIYMLFTVLLIAIAILVISLCILLGKRYATNKVIVALKNTGQLALTFYVAHVVLGVGVIEAISPSKMGTYSIQFSVGYALIFSLLCIVFANLWLKFKHYGPLEGIMKMIVK